MPNRKAIYYWKCDRPSAFRTLAHTWLDPETRQGIERTVEQLLQEFIGNNAFKLTPGKGQGNHLTFLAEAEKTTYFIRVENGPEKDNYMEVEAHVLNCVRDAGVPTPKVYRSDSSRKQVPYSYQILQYFSSPDLNFWHKKGQLNLVKHAYTIGQSIARWQSVKTEGFGPFDPGALKTNGTLTGFHHSYADYFFLNLAKHLRFLVDNRTLSQEESDLIEETIDNSRHLLDIHQGCLVHKDLALWNILGNQDKIDAFIDWDDTISGDPTDDLSLLACFHSEPVLDAAIEGYTAIKPLPDNFYPRFWLHLLRNMIVKAVIRVGGGYFSKKSDFFLIETETNGANLEETTRQRIHAALDGLAANKALFQL